MADFRQRLSMVEKQTELLLEKQVEAKKYCDDKFSDLLSMIDQKIQELDEQSDEYKSLIRINDLITKQFSEFTDEVDQDIQFLKEQLKAVRSINEIDDEKKAKELFSSILEDDEELLDMEEFKKKMEQEAVLSRKGFLSIMGDIENSIKENNLDELEATLQEMKEEREDSDLDQDQDILETLHNSDEFRTDSCDDDSCDSTCCSSCPSSRKGCGMDIFSGLFDDKDEDKKE